MPQSQTCLAIILLFLSLSSAEIEVNTLNSPADDFKQMDGTQLTLKPLHETGIADRSPMDTVEHSTPEPVAGHPSDIVSFSKQMYSSLAAGTAVEIAEHFKSTFDSLNQDKRLADELNIVYDMRLMDLQASIRHARKMKEVLSILSL
jgi:hypothetical protein